MTRSHDREKIEELLELREREKLTYKQLAERSGIPMPTLTGWSLRLRKEGSARKRAASNDG